MVDAMSAIISIIISATCASIPHRVDAETESTHFC